MSEQVVPPDAPAEGALGHFRSKDFPGRDCFATFLELQEAGFPGSETWRPDDDAPFFASLRMRALPQLRLMWGSLGATFNTRRRTDDFDDFTLFVNLGEPALASQHRREFEFGPGDAYLMAPDETGSLHRRTTGSMVCIRVPQEAIAPFVRNAHDCVGRLIPRHSEGLNLLARYVQLLDESEPLATERERALAATHILDLLALALGATSDARELAGRRGARAALIKSIKAHVERNAGRGDLSLETVAARFGVSPRSVQRLFADEGTSLTNLIHERRLILAHRMLANRRFESRRVGEIALDAGFADLSHFNRLFRKRFGQTPSDVRNAFRRQS